MRTLPLLIAFFAFSTAGCVSQGKYDATVATLAKERARANAERVESARRVSAEKAEIARLHQLGAEAEARCAVVAGELTQQQAAATSCTRALDDAMALNNGLRAELARMGKDVDKLLSTKSTLSSSLDQARARLDELRRAQAAADARAALFRDVALRLKRMIDAGELQITLRSGRMVLVLPNDVLFDSGKAKLEPRGAEAISQVAAVLATLSGRRFQVAGHTDDDPIRYSGFPSNWELSSARALSVVRHLIQSKVAPAGLSAAGFAEFDPVAPNDVAGNKAKNRRIEIVVLPNIDEVVAVPTAG
jgi:chemotaxis protein MotB